MPLEQKSNVEVAIRIRPIRKEIGESIPNWDVQKKLIIERPNPDNRFTFDRIYDQQSTTTDLYQNSVRNTIVQNVSKGYNGTVFAYGQTGSGKSFTMLGEGLEEKNEGIVNMAIRDLFVALDKDKKEQERDGYLKVQINVYVAMLEIYNEQLRDLLTSPGTVVLPLAIRENEHGVYVHNATRRPVKSASECLQVIHNEALIRRVSASTSMNEQSSRSHCLIRILVEKTIHYEDDSDESSDGEEMGNIGSNEKKIVSSMNLVDLAGSERVAKTGATGQRMVEGGHINKSLTILTTVINRLTESGSKTVTHVPYRDSKLTHLLKTALGGNSLTTVFCCMTVAEEHTDESRSTLQFASRAKTIRNQVQMNEVSDHKTRLREVELELKRCKKLMVATTIYLWSKDVKIRNLKEGLGAIPSTSVSDSRLGPAHQTGQIVTAEGEIVDASQVEQMQILIEQLTDQNEKLQDELLEAIRKPNTGGDFGSHVDPLIDVADDEEKHQLKKDVEDLQTMLEESELELKAVKESLEELEAVVEELEAEVEDKESEVADLGKRARGLEVQAKGFKSLEKDYKAQIELLQHKIQKKDADTIKKVQGSGDTLEHLTKLHMEHETLCFEHNELANLHSRSEIEHKSQIELLNDRIDEIQNETEKEKQSAQLSNSYCWRILNVAHLAVHGKPVETDTDADLTAPIREHQIDQAVKALTSFVNSRSSKPPSIISNAPTPAVAVEDTPPAKEDPGKSAANCSTNTFKNEDEYKKKIVDLEKVILTKDAQRDIIIDTKLKRLQELVLRLQTTNLSLCTEIKNVVRENYNLFEIIKKDPKLTRSLNKTNYQQVVEDEIMLRALSAPIPQRPFGHN